MNFKLLALIPVAISVITSYLGYKDTSLHFILGMAAMRIYKLKNINELWKM